MTEFGNLAQMSMVAELYLLNWRLAVYMNQCRIDAANVCEAVQKLLQLWPWCGVVRVDNTL